MQQLGGCQKQINEEIINNYPPPFCLKMITLFINACESFSSRETSTVKVKKQ